MGRIYHMEFIRPVRAYSISITLLSVDFASFQFIFAANIRPQFQFCGFRFDRATKVNSIFSEEDEEAAKLAAALSIATFLHSINGFET